MTCKWHNVDQNKPCKLRRKTDFGYASYYGDHMVLQRAPTDAVLWGYAQEIGDEVTIEMDTQTIVMNAFEGPNGGVIWEAHLEAVDEDGPFTITASSSDCSVSLNDVLFGDVWICSGQSNMVHRFDNVDDPEPDLEDSVNYPNVCAMAAATVLSETPVEDLDSIMIPWTLLSQKTISEFSSVFWFYGRNLNRKLNRPIGLVQAALSGTRIEAWSSPEALENCFPDGPSEGSGASNGPSVLWNAMIHPLLRMAIKGAIWYQGKFYNNTGNNWAYGCALTEMVKEWRKNWFEKTNGQVNERFPFGQVQLAPNEDNDADTGFPDVRWHQTYEYGFTPNALMENIFTAVALDLPDFDSPNGSIHPRYKRQISERLYLAALEVAYGDSSEGRFQGPYPASVIRGDDEIEVTIFDYDHPVCCAVDESTFCGSGEWDTATVVGSTDVTVTLSNPCSIDDDVTGVRYAWRESPCALELCAVYSEENSLPAPPFVLNQHFSRNTPVKI
ncbi:hypothetical protein CAPTEDRAFT_122541 [Capitella teleta]|uniref:Sialate O-acetylesterase domain-containing protein n=1 Tax=Capitella teleta TaxID=283909 RepID=R7VGI4_CAPTE|nr:hypothetical protein CAPTEDRAFT_122541 [Capitella teleta]|eukprot:ELU17662.1 hypothetical protein CAPTEDRAFT_122541 [Capitella teleta]